MNIGYLPRGYAHVDQLAPQVVVHVEALGLRGAQVAEHDLDAARRFAVPPYAPDLLRGRGGLRPVPVRQVGDHEPRVGPPAELRHHAHLLRRRLQRHVLAPRLRDARQRYVGGGLDVANGGEHRDELGQVGERREPGLYLEAGALRLELERGGLPSEHRRPCVEAVQPGERERLRLQVALHVVDLGHAVGHGRPRREHDPLVARPLVDPARLVEHVGRALAVAGLQAGHVSHLRLREQVLIVVGLVDEDAVDAQVGEVEHVVLVVLTRLLETRLEALPAPLELLDGEPLRGVVRHPRLVDGVLDPDLFLLDVAGLQLGRQRDLGELRLGHDDRVPVARRDARHEALAVVLLEVGVGGHEDRRLRVEPHELDAPLPYQVLRHREQRL